MSGFHQKWRQKPYPTRNCPPSPNYPPQSSLPQSYSGFRVWVTAPPLPFVPKHSIRRLIPLTVVVGSLAQFHCFFCSRLCVKMEGCFLSATCAVWTSGACTVSIIYPKPCSPSLPPPHATIFPREYIPKRVWQNSHTTGIRTETSAALFFACSPKIILYKTVLI